MRSASIATSGSLPAASLFCCRRARSIRAASRFASAAFAGENASAFFRSRGPAGLDAPESRPSASSREPRGRP
eukprot:3266715-Prymnesium_polylepis.1